MGLILGYIFATQIPATPGIPNQANQAPGTTPTPLPQQPKEPESVQNLPPIDVKTDHIRGNPNASVAVIEYSDFECPFCKRHHSTMKQIMETYSKDVLWIYRHYPLNFHANAQKEEEAVDCAAEQGGNDAFWRFADIIFDKTTSNGTGFPLTELPVAAKAIGLNADQFQTCLDSGKYADHVKTMMAGGTAAGISGTPGNVIVNRKTQENKLLSGALPFEQFKTVIDGFLK
ncbi:MAG TPA: DsbA family protein [Gemmatales bacterium]|nr:DsbA family protein [Gemmatales bacterium]